MKVLLFIYKIKYMKKRMKFLSVVALSSVALLGYGFSTTDINHEQVVYETQESEISTQEVSTNTETIISVNNTILNSIELVDWKTDATSTYWELTMAFNYQPYINFTPVVQWDVIGPSAGSAYDWKDVNGDTETIAVGNVIFVEKHDEPDRYVDYFTISGQSDGSDGLVTNTEYTFAFNVTDGSILADENVTEITITTPEEYLAEVTLNYISDTAASFNLIFDENIINSPQIEYSRNNGNTWIDVTPLVDADKYSQTIVVEGLTAGTTNNIQFRIDGVVQTIAVQIDTLSVIEAQSMIDEVEVTSLSPYLAELTLTINSANYLKAQGINLDYKIQTEEEYANGEKDIWVNSRATFDEESSSVVLNFNETYLLEDTTYIVQFRINGVEQTIGTGTTFEFTTESFTDYGLMAGIISGSIMLGVLLIFGGYYLYNRTHKSKKDKKEKE